MLVVTYSEARQNFASILDKAKSEGAVLIKRADGSVFRIIPEVGEGSPFANIKTLADFSHEDIQQALNYDWRNRFSLLN